jgi:hypothetical protein
MSGRSGDGKRILAVLLSNRLLAVFLVFCLMTACVGQAVMLSAAPHSESLRSISHTVRHRIAAGFRRHCHMRVVCSVTIIEIVL